MFKELKAILYYLAVDIRFSFTVFWSILLVSLTALFIVSFSFNTTMLVSSSIAIYIFCFITGFLMTKETFPYCIKLGATRTQYLVSALVFFACVAFVFSFVHMVVQTIFKTVASFGTIENIQMMYSVHGTTLQDTWYNQVFVDFIICFLLISIGFLLGTIFYRLGLIGGFSTLALLVIILLIPSARGWVAETFASLEGSKIALNYAYVILLALLTFLPNWGMLRKASTISSATR